MNHTLGFTTLSFKRDLAINRVTRSMGVTWVQLFVCSCRYRVSMETVKLLSLYLETSKAYGI